MNAKIKNLRIPLLATMLLLLIITGVFLSPNLLQTNSTLLPLKFTTTRQTDNGGKLTLYGSFHRDLSAGEPLWLYAENARIEISISGTTHQFNGLEGTPAMFRSPGSGWFSFPSPKLKSGEPVVLTVYSYYGENDRAAQNLLCRLYTGDGIGLLKLLLAQIDFFGIVLICASISGIIYILEGAIDTVLGIPDGLRITLFGLYFLTGGLWCVPDVLYPYISLFITPAWIAAFIDISGLLLFPIVLAYMMRYYIRGKFNHSIMNGMLCAEIITAVICLLLQISGLADLMEQQLFVGAVALFSLGTSILCVVAELRHYKDRHLLFLFLSVLPVFLCEIIDGINLIWPFMPRRTLMQYGFGISILLLVFQFVSFANTQLANTEKLRKAELALVDFRISNMLSQIQPHFLYNSLSNIKYLCDTDPHRASEALEHFSFYLRGNLDALTNMRLVPFEKELAHIKDYLFLEKMRFSERLQVEWHLSYLDFMLPPLTVQPMIENAIRHGINKSKKGGTITIQSERQEDIIIITISDNGIGFRPTEKKNDGRSHIGIQNTIERLKLLCSGSLTIESEEGKGTVVKIILPQKNVMQ